MRRVLVAALSVILVLTLALPGVALAGKPAGRGSSAAPGQLKKAVIDPSSNRSDTGEERKKAADDEVGGGSDDDGSTAADKASGKPEWAGKPGSAGGTKSASGDHKGATGRGRAARSMAASASPEPSSTVHPGRRGIDNALSRIERNMTRAQTRVAEGTMERVPPGLLRVLQKFLGWLGLQPAPDDSGDPDDGDAAETPPADDGSTEESSTPEPGQEESATPLPEIEDAGNAPSQ